MISFVTGGLNDLSVSRTSFKWGIPVPADADHIIYVWLDALTNYITALGYPDQENELFSKYWRADLHMVGKDILRFHAVYWPAFLMGAGLEVPKRIFAHGWWTNEGRKISKSLGNIIDPMALVEKYGLDQVRYFLLREVPFGNDGDFSHRAMVGRLNADLANDLGNLAQRVLSMIARNCDGKLPPPEDAGGAGELEVFAVLASAHGLPADVRAAMERQAFHEVLDAIWAVVRAANRAVDADAPWALRKTDPDRMASVLYILVEVMRHIAILLQPFMPGSMARLLDQLGVAEGAREFSNLGPDGALTPGTALPKPEGIFPRFSDEGEGAD